MIVEIGHFYTNEVFDSEGLKYLYQQKFRDEDTLFLFIDDYTFQSDILNVSLLVTECEKILGRSVFIEYESKMARHFNYALQFLDENKIKKVTIKNEPVELFYENKKIYDYATARPTCQMLSFIWTLVRLGLIDGYGKTKDVLTVIDKKYMKLENRVFEMVPIEHRKNLFYRFF